MTKRELLIANDVEEVTEEQIREMRNHNIQKAEELLTVIETVKVKQEAWQAVLTTAMVQEKEEEAAASKLFRAVTKSQETTFKDSAFQRWMDTKIEKEGGTIGLTKLAAWYHDDVLIGRSPFAAVVPFPADLTDAGKEELISTIDSTVQGKWYVENVPDLPLASTVEGLLKGKGGSTDFDYLSMPFSSGRELLDFLGTPAAHVLRKALSVSSGTPCLMLNDADGPVGSATHQRRGAPPVNCAVFRCIVIRGWPVVAEFAMKEISGELRPVPDDEGRLDLAERLKKYLSGMIGSTVLAHRSVVVTVVGCEDRGLISNFYLHSVYPFDAIPSDCWTLEEVLLVAEYGDRLRDQGAVSPLLLRQQGDTHKSLPIALGVMKETAASVPAQGAPAGTTSLSLIVAVAAGSALVAALGTSLLMRGRN